MVLRRYRKTINFAVDFSGYIMFLFLVSTGALLKFVLLPGWKRGSAPPAELLGLDRHDWSEVHFWIAIGFLTAITLHLILHWEWVRGMFGTLLGWRSRKLVAAALLLPAVLAALPFLFTPTVAEQHHRRGGLYPDGQNTHQTKTSSNRGQLRGQTTLVELEQSLGIDVPALLSSLLAPKDLPQTTELRDLAHISGMSMAELRQIIQENTASHKTKLH